MYICIYVYMYKISSITYSRNVVISRAGKQYDYSYGYDYDYYYSSDVLSCCETWTNVVQSAMCLMQEAFIQVHVLRSPPR